MVAAESGEARASRLRALAAERQTHADHYAALADAVEKGNHGERVVADLLDVLDGAGWYVLHDRYEPGSTANLDHVVVGPPGVFVIDAKNWKPATLRFDERGMSLRGYRKDDELRVAADCAGLVEQRALGACADLPVAGVLAFVQDMSVETPVEHQGVWILQSKDLLTWLTSQEPKLDRATVQRVGSTLDAALPPRVGRAQPFTVTELTCERPPGARPAGGARMPSSARRPDRGARPPGAQRRAARRGGGTVRELVVKLAAVIAFAFVVVPTVLDGIVDRMAEVRRPQPSSGPTAPVATTPEQAPAAPSR